MESLSFSHFQIVYPVFFMITTLMATIVISRIFEHKRTVLITVKQPDYRNDSFRRNIGKT